MRRSASFGIAVVTALALATPVLAGSASAVPSGTSATSASSPVSATSADQAHKPKKKKGKKGKIKLSSSVAGAQPGIAGAKITAKKLTRGGKVTFTLNGAPLGKVKAKKGKATFTMPALGTGTYEVGAKLGKQKGKLSYRVYQSALTLSPSPASFTICTAISAACSASVNQTMNGTVLFKDQTPNKGYVDIYPLGAPFGNPITFAGVGAADITPQPAGTFTFQRGGAGTTNSFLFKVRSLYGPGVYQFQAFYTETPSYAEYIASNLITVTVQ